MLPQPDFVGAMKNKRTLASLHDAVDTLLASAKIAANEAAADIRAKLAWHKENAAGYEILFADLQQIIGKAADDFKLVVTSRIAAHKQAEDARLTRVREEERIRVEAAVAAPQVAPAVEQRRAYHQSNFNQFTADARERADTERKTGLPAGSLRPVEAIEGPSDREIIDLIAATFDLTFADAVERVEAISFDELRAVAA
jgi:hypothetical protein